MKLTKQKLEKLIMEEYVRSIGDEYKPTNYPEYADKLTALAKDDYPQARELADTLDEPIDVELGSDDFMEFIPFGIRQFEQQSFITATGMTLGLVEIFFDTQDKDWTVGVYRGSSPNSFSYDGRRSKTFTEAEEAINYYNQFADKKFVKKSTWQAIDNVL